jgi:ectoine hydroxylase-related dioxygenase (phytanoyl-CoA dioxygenase family)
MVPSRRGLYDIESVGEPAALVNLRERVMAVEITRRADGPTHRIPPPRAAGSTPQHLSPDEIRFFDENGYLVLRNRIGGRLLERLREAGDAWIRQGMRPDAGEDFKFQDVNGQPTMFRVDYLHNKEQPASLELLGCPEVLAVAESFCGPNFVPTYESMVFKQEGNGAAIQWHQDACHPGTYRIFNLDVYLDASKAGAGALKVVPGSNWRRQDICLIKDEHGWTPPGAIDVEMEPGDVLLHDVMVVHGSEQTEGNALRRTIYYEFRAAEEIIEDGPWDREWIDRRLRLVPLALRRYRDAYPAAAHFEWRASSEFRPTTTGEEDAELRIAHEVHMSGAYCSAGDAPGKQ